MRWHFVIAAAAILLAGFGLTLIAFLHPIAEGIAGGVKSFSSDASQTRGTAQLLIQKIHDMTVVFSQGD